MAAHFICNGSASRSNALERVPRRLHTNERQFAFGSKGSLMRLTSRRRFVATIGVAAVAPASGLLAVARAEAAAAQQRAQTVSPAVPAKPVYLFFNLAEAAFIESACERLEHHRTRPQPVRTLFSHHDQSGVPEMR